MLLEALWRAVRDSTTRICPWAGRQPLPAPVPTAGVPCENVTMLESPTSKPLETLNEDNGGQGGMPVWAIAFLAIFVLVVIPIPGAPAEPCRKIRLLFLISLLFQRI
jgi:hypothetical protein